MVRPWVLHQVLRLRTTQYLLWYSQPAILSQHLVASFCIMVWWLLNATCPWLTVLKWAAWLLTPDSFQSLWTGSFVSNNTFWKCYTNSYSHFVGPQVGLSLPSSSIHFEITHKEGFLFVCSNFTWFVHHTCPLLELTWHIHILLYKCWDDAWVLRRMTTMLKHLPSLTHQNCLCHVCVQSVYSMCVDIYLEWFEWIIINC